jgi:Toprim-like
VASVLKTTRAPLAWKWPTGDDSLKARCIRPDHHDARPSMLISNDHVYCFGCGSFWWPDQFLRELGDRSLIAIPASRRRGEKPVRYIPMTLVDTFNKWLNTVYSSRLEWLHSRGLRLEDSINANKLGYDGTAFVIPVIDGDVVQSLRFRRDDAWETDDDDESPKYWGMSGKNSVTLYKPVIPVWVDLRSDAIHLCEGELDALRLSQEGFIAWSLTNGCRAFRKEHIQEFAGKELKIVYDQDGPGRDAAHRVSRMLTCKVVTWPEVLGKDVTEYLQRWSLQSFLQHF